MKVLIFGNSGSGKSTLAKKLSQSNGLAHLDLDESYADEIIFMNLSVDDCINNAKSRPWEPHKYESKQAQDNNLAMLIEWIAQYPKRDGVLSLISHQGFYDQYQGKKRMITSNEVS